MAFRRSIFHVLLLVNKVSLSSADCLYFVVLVRLTDGWYTLAAEDPGNYLRLNYAILNHERGASAQPTFDTTLCAYARVALDFFSAAR